MAVKKHVFPDVNIAHKMLYITCKDVHVVLFHCRHHELLYFRAPAGRKENKHVDVTKTAHSLNGGASGVSGSTFSKNIVSKPCIYYVLERFTILLTDQ